MTPLPASKALNDYFFEARSKLLDLAAILDRIDRGSDASATTSDARLQRVRQALQVLLSNEPARAEKIQHIFSLDYDAAWEKPKPRY